MSLTLTASDSLSCVIRQQRNTRWCSEAERDLGPSDRINLHVRTSWAVLGCIEINRGDVFNVLNIDMRWMDTGVIAQPHALNDGSSI